MQKQAEIAAYRLTNGQKSAARIKEQKEMAAS